MFVTNKNFWLSMSISLGILSTSSAHAGLLLSPVRCAGDNLEQWAHDINPAQYPESYPPDGSARGRNAWWFVCNPIQYQTINKGYRTSGIAAEKDPTANHGNGIITRWYPTFGVETGVNPNGEVTFERPGGWTAPTSAPPSASDARCALPANYDLVGMCASGCVTPEQEIASETDFVAIEDLEARVAPSVLVPSQLSPGAKSYTPIKVRRFIKDGTDAPQKIVVVNTKSGGSVRVSLNHPLLTQDYTMRRADALVAGDSLVQADGALDEITDVRIEEYYGKLHNLTVDTSKLEKSVYIVRGYISGDKKHQDLALSDVNRQILRNLIK